MKSELKKAVMLLVIVSIVISVSYYKRSYDSVSYQIDCKLYIEENNFINIENFEFRGKKYRDSSGFLGNVYSELLVMEDIFVRDGFFYRYDESGNKKELGHYVFTDKATNLTINITDKLLFDQICIEFKNSIEFGDDIIIKNIKVNNY